MTIVHLGFMLHMSAFSEIEGSWYHAIKRSEPEHWNTSARPFFAVLLNILLYFSSEKSIAIKLSFHNIYLSTQLQGELVFTSCFTFPWDGDDWAWTSWCYGQTIAMITVKSHCWELQWHGLNNIPEALFSSIPKKFWEAMSLPKITAVRFLYPIVR